MDLKVGDVVRNMYAIDETRRQVVLEVPIRGVVLMELIDSKNDKTIRGYKYHIFDRCMVIKVSKLERLLLGLDHEL